MSEGASAYAYNDAVRRIGELERLNATLAAQVDRDRLVIKMAELWCDNEKGFTRIALREAVDTYRRTMAQLAKEGR